jgi:hypothetical protein
MSCPAEHAFFLWPYHKETLEGKPFGGGAGSGGRVRDRPAIHAGLGVHFATRRRRRIEKAEAVGKNPNRKTFLYPRPKLIAILWRFWMSPAPPPKL